MSNVPQVAIQIPILRADGVAPTPAAPWLALAGESTFAGNVTLRGAASNLIVGRIAERAGVPYRLGPFERYGLPLAVITVAVLVACLGSGP